MGLNLKDETVSSTGLSITSNVGSVSVPDQLILYYQEFLQHGNVEFIPVIRGNISTFTQLVQYLWWTCR